MQEEGISGRTTAVRPDWTLLELLEALCFGRVLLQARQENTYRDKEHFPQALPATLGHKLYSF